MSDTPLPRVLARAAFRRSVEDFRVTEIPSYLPTGQGEHLYVKVTKSGRNTHDVVRALTRALACKEMDIGVAGQKDKWAITEQLMSLPAKFEAQLRTILEKREEHDPFEGVTFEILGRHGNKLRMGHLVGNRFLIVLRDLRSAHTGEKLTEAEAEEITKAVERTRTEGFPNFYGEQRFGNNGGNTERAIAFLSGNVRERLPVQKIKFLVSSLQSHVFNRILERRIHDGTWISALDGDVLQKADSGGLFVSTDAVADQERCLRGELSPTAPMFGPEAKESTGEAKALEDAVLREVLGDPFPFAEAAKWASGTRRALRIFATELQFRWISENSNHFDGISFDFVLPKGAYATTFLGNFFDLAQPSGSHLPALDAVTV